MKKTITISILALALLSGCTKNRFLSSERLAPISLTPNFGATATKATITDANIIDETIRVQVSKNDGQTSYAVDGSKYTLGYNDVSTLWSLSNMLYLSAENAKIYAYAPSPTEQIAIAAVETGEFNTLKRELDIPATQTMASQVDFLWCYQEKTQEGGSDNINSSKPSVALTMKHALTQVAFVIFGENYNGAGAINTITIKDNTGSPAFRIMNDPINDLYMKVLDGSIIGGKPAAELSVTGISGSILTTTPVTTDLVGLKASVNGYLLLVPATITPKSNIRFTFNIDGKDYNVSLTGSESLAWEAGQQYIYTVKLTGTVMQVISVTVTPWNSSHEGEVVIN
ncbi:MAG: hypothetical protein CVU12_00585 [Bacteroidetes bacterium HGW-Bacteroidetes-7]|jgi:hypothetical protein|nr:MAG: hypothetical protein CVU12_00585 [Bacteroidetes bacterium HGW-Bacteroidetes-7]